MAYYRGRFSCSQDDLPVAKLLSDVGESQLASCLLDSLTREERVDTGFLDADQMIDWG